MHNFDATKNIFMHIWLFLPTHDYFEPTNDYFYTTMMKITCWPWFLSTNDYFYHRMNIFSQSNYLHLINTYLPYK